MRRKKLSVNGYGVAAGLNGPRQWLWTSISYGYFSAMQHAVECRASRPDWYRSPLTAYSLKQAWVRTMWRKNKKKWGLAIVKVKLKEI